MSDFSTGDAYESVRVAIDDLTRLLSAEQLATPAPGCPGWSVHDIVAHCAGLAVDAVNGVGAGDDLDAWTARHVADRADRPTTDVLDEWATVTPEFRTKLDADRPRFPAALIDVHCHQVDIEGALETSTRRSHDFETTLETRMVAGWIARVADAELPALMVMAPTGDPYDGDVGAPVVCRAAPDFIHRATLGRRSRRQIASTLTGTSNKDAYVDALCHFPPSKLDIAV